jgi:hypothetical protein
VIAKGSKKKELDAEKCHYCEHFFAFRQSWVQHARPSPIITDSYASPNGIANGTRFTSVRQELLASFRPSLTVPLNNIQSRRQRHQKIYKVSRN